MQLCDPFYYRSYKCKFERNDLIRFLRLPLSNDGETVDKTYTISHNLEARSLLHGLFDIAAPKTS